MSEKAIAEKEVDEVQINAYMEDPGEDAPSDERRVQYYRAMLEDVRRTYAHLQVEREQAERMKDNDRLNKITTFMRENYKMRRDSVIALRDLGEEVKDRWVPFSATK